MQPLGGKKDKRNHATSWDKRNHATSWDKKNYATPWDKKNYATSWDKKNPQPLGSRLSEIVLKGQKWSKNLQISVKEYQNVQYRLKWS